jgi:ABC-type multidrug transport system ATPase subunit
MLLIEGVSKNFGSTIALRDVDLVIEPGEIAALLGPHGAGKSTLASVVVCDLRHWP